MTDIFNMIFSQQFLIRALVVGVLISACCALLGVSLVLKRFSMIGDGLSHVGFGAIAIACAANIAPLYFSLPIVIVAAFLLLRMNEKGKIKGDAAIALLSTGALAVGVMATSLKSGMNIDIYNYMFGSILTMTNSDIVIAVILAACVIAIFVCFYDEIFAVTFDESFAKASGIKVSVYNSLIAVLTAVTIVIGMRMMGAMLISSLIIFPTVISMRVCKSYRKVVFCGVAVSVLCFVSGLIVSIRFQAPTGASVVCINIFALAVFALIGKIKALNKASALSKFKKPLIALVSVVSAAVLVIVMFSGSVSYVSTDKLSVITTGFASYDFARQVCGEKAQVTMLLSPGEESHTFEPTPQDILEINSCDLFIYGGGESDEWVKSVLSGVDNKEMSILSMMEITGSVKEELLEGMQEDKNHEHDHEHEEEEYDEHVWTSPSNAVKIISAIKDVLCQTDSQNSEYYVTNAEKYIASINSLSKRFELLSEKAQSKCFIVADRFPFKYFADEYNFNFYAAFPGCSAQSDVNPTTLAFLCNKVKENSIGVVFKVDLSSGNVASCISEETGAAVKTLYSCHTVSKADFENGETYVSLMTRNLNALEEAME